MSFVTSEQAPITEFSPMVTPGSTVTLAPSHTLQPMVTGRENCVIPSRRSGRIGCPVVVMVTFGPIIAYSPICTSASSTNVRLKFA